jgi:hypothetical protein
MIGERLEQTRLPAGHQGYQGWSKSSRRDPWQPTGGSYEKRQVNHYEKIDEAKTAK